MIGAMGFLGGLYLVALFYQDGLGLSALQSGLSTFPEAVGVVTGAQLITRYLYPTIGPRRIMMSGLVIQSSALLLMARVGPSTSLWWARALLFLMGFGMSGVLMPSQAASFATITAAKTGRASALFNAQRQLGGAIGVALLSTVLAGIGPTRVEGTRLVAHLVAYHWAFVAAAAVTLPALLVALGMRDADAAATMTPRRRRRGAKTQGQLVADVG
jgi:MFS family permease